MVCKKEKIVQKVIRYSPYSRGARAYSLYIALDSENELEVSLEQLRKGTNAEQFFNCFSIEKGTF